MALRWTSRAHSDLERLYEFLAPVHAAAAVRVARKLVAAAKRVPSRPRLGVLLREYGTREVRRIIVGDYEIRYELTETDVFILRIFHTREDR